MLNQVARSLARTLGRSARQVLQSAVAPPFHFTSESGAEFASFYCWAAECRSSNVFMSA